MINQLFGAGVAALVVGLAAPVIVSTRHPLIGRAVPTEAVPLNEACDASHRTESLSDAGFLGVVVARQMVELSARFDGTVERVDVQVGDRVKSGTPVARLDDRAVSLELAMAEASGRAAEAEHDRARIEWEDASSRLARLRSIAELVAREQIAAAESQEKGMAARLRASRGEVAGRRARIDQLRAQVRDAEIVAPFDGTIAARYLDAGTTVNRSTPIVRIISPKSLIIRFGVPEEEEATRVAIGLPVLVRGSSGDMTVDGVIDRIVPEIDAALRMVVVEARLAGDGDAQMPAAGAIARVLLAAHPRVGGDATRVASPVVSASVGHERSIH